MATSLPSVTLEPGTWTDLYSATGITTGIQLTIQNIGSDEAKLSESVAEPTSTVGRNNLSINVYVDSATTPVGVWAYSRNGTVLQVEAT